MWSWFAARGPLHNTRRNVVAQKGYQQDNRQRLENQVSRLVLEGMRGEGGKGPVSTVVTEFHCECGCEF